MTRPVTREYEQGGDRLQWPAGQFPHGIQFIFKDYDYSEIVGGSKIGNLSSDGGAGQQWLTAKNRRAKEKDSFVLELPFPTSLQDSTGVQIQGFERGFIEEFLTNAAVGFADDPIGAATAMGNAIASAAGGAAGGIAGGDFSGVFGDDASGKQNAGMFKRLVGTLGTSILGQLGMGEKSIGAALGSVTNPLTTLHFSGVNLRSFTFAWSLYPANATEATDIRDIVRRVKSKILPMTQGLRPAGEAAAGITEFTQGGLARAYLKYPSVVFINLLGVNESHYPKFKVCMCGGIDINYAHNGGVAIAKGGVPMGISISMSFQELEIQTAEDYGSDSAKSIDIPELTEVADTTAGTT